MPKSDLTAKGYRVLSRLDERRGGHLHPRAARPQPFVFCQGHPEYDAETLGREYLRDMGRFLRGESGDVPPMPENYFDRATENRLAELAASAANRTWRAIARS